jgi:hypothetical protein
VINYIIEEMRPLATVDKPSFKHLLEIVSNGAFKPVCRQTLSKQISNYTEDCKIEVIKIMSGHDYICTTADIWSQNNKSFFGVTAHIINNDTLGRKSYVLACRRIKFTHTYSEIASLLHEIHKSFITNIHTTVGTVTDNASNFGKAFKIFATSENPKCQYELEDQNNDIEIADLNFSQFNCDDEVNDIILPPQFRCCSHTLNLIATTDIQKALTANNASCGVSVKKNYHSAFGKLTAIWNTCSRSTKASDEIERICKRKLCVPCATRWNSLYDSVVAILEVRSHLETICEILEKPKLKNVELEFLSEYVEVMRPCHWL